jgi:hypothetical protein
MCFAPFPSVSFVLKFKPTLIHVHTHIFPQMCICIYAGSYAHTVLATASASASASSSAGSATSPRGRPAGHPRLDFKTLMAQGRAKSQVCEFDDPEITIAVGSKNVSRNHPPVTAAASYVTIRDGEGNEYIVPEAILLASQVTRCIGGFV